MESICPLCGSSASPYVLIDRWNPPLEIWRCGSCRFQFQAVEEYPSHLYGEGYYTGNAVYSYQDERKNKDASMAVWKARAKVLSSLDVSRGPKRWLDVGCAFGGLMEAAQERGYEPYGLEISSYSGGYAAERFPDHVWIGNVEDYPLPEDFFSVVSLVELIEHLSKPVQALENIYRSLQRGGLLLVQTADMDGLQARLAEKRYHYYLPGHLSYFDRHNLRMILERVGFRKVKFIGGVEFGLLPKLIKSRVNFHSLWDYRHWVRISLYHLASKITIGRWHLTSSMVMLAWKE